MVNVPTRCKICQTPLEMRVGRDNQTEARFVFTSHSDSLCKAMVQKRIVVLQESLSEVLQREEVQRRCLDELARWIGTMTYITDSGRVWLELRQKRIEYLDRLRGAFGSSERRGEDPLWKAERELAEHLTKAIEMVSVQRSGG